jgi:hypothetical protein
VVDSGVRTAMLSASVAIIEKSTLHKPLENDFYIWQSVFCVVDSIVDCGVRKAILSASVATIENAKCHKHLENYF